MEATQALLDDEGEYAQMAQAVNPYGDGQAAGRIVRALVGEPVEMWHPSDRVAA